MSFETAQLSSTTPSDEALIAELTPEMLTKLKLDSRREAGSTGFICMLFGAFALPHYAKQADNWLSLGLILFGMALGIFALVTIARSFMGQPSALRNELRYRRQHGRWRWER